MDKKILHVINTMNIGGAETQIMKYYRSLNRQEFQFDFLLLNPIDSYYEKEIVQLGGKIHKLKAPLKKSPLKAIRELLRVMRDYSAVHAHCSFFNGILLFLSFISRVTVRASHIHTSEDEKENKYRYLYRILTKALIKMFATHKLACSENASIFLYSKVETILKNALFVDDYFINDFEKQKMRKDLNITEKDKVIGHIGRFHKVKNHQFLLSLFKNLADKNENLKLILIGTGQLEAEMKKYVVDNNLENKALFLGLRSDIPKLLSVMDLFLFPSIYEGLPLALVEAQAAGVQILASSSITKEVDMGLDLIEFEELDVERWESKAKQLLKNEKIICKEVINEKFRQKGYNIENQIRILENIYSEAF